jgi:hypothetical protein
MSLGHSPKIVTNGLVFYYDMGNPQKSWKGAPTTNVVTNTNLDTGWSKGYNTGIQWNDYQPPDGVSSQVVSFIDLDGNGSGYWYSYGDYAPQDPSTTYTVSIYARTVGSDWTIRAYTADNSEVGRQNTNTLTVPGDGRWYRLVFNSFTTPSNTQSDSLSFVFLSIPANQRCWLCAPQMEVGTFATPFVNSTRSSTQAIVDLTGQNTVTATSLTYQSDNTFTFSSGDYLVLSDDCSTIFGTGAVSTTLEMWVKPQGTNNFIYYGQQNTSGERLYAGGLADVWDFGWGGSSWGDAVSGTLPACVSGVWQHIVLSIDGGVASLYKNGIYAASKTDTSVNMTGTFPIGTYYSGGIKDNGYDTAKDIPVFKIYNRALSAAEVRQNFNALRGRYGL